MALVVETGAGLLGADAYVSVAACQAYAANFGLTFDIADDAASEAAIRRATAYIDNAYRRRFPGYRTNRSLQALEWPRVGAYYYQEDTGGTPFGPSVGYGYGAYPYDVIPSNVLPVEIVQATCEGAVREFAKPGTLQPDLKRGGQIASVKAGSVSVRYGGGASPNVVFQVIEAKLSRLISRDSGYSTRAVR